MEKEGGGDGAGATWLWTFIPCKRRQLCQSNRKASCSVCSKNLVSQELRSAVPSPQESVQPALATHQVTTYKTFPVGCSGLGGVGRREAGFPCEQRAAPGAAEEVERSFILLSVCCLREAWDKKGKETRKRKGPCIGSKSKEPPFYSFTLLILPIPDPCEVVYKFISEPSIERSMRFL